MAAAGVRRAGGRFRTGGGGSGYYLLAGDFGGAGGFSGVLEEAPAPAPAEVDAPATAGRDAPPAGPSAMAARMTPAVLFVTVVLAVVLLVSGLLHVLRRLFLKTHHGGAAGPGDRHHLQHLFFPGGGGGGDDGAGGSGSGGGLAQAAIDALPEFAYAELSGATAAASRKGKEKASRPFDCAVCLCEFADADRLRLLPACGHAFHLACIDVWLRSSATCPLCRIKLSPRHLAAAADAEADEHKQQQDHQAPDEAAEAAAASSVVLPVRLGRFTCADGGAEAGTRSSNSGARIDGARRCYSMGSYQYVLADDHLLLSVHMRHGDNAGGATGGGDDRQQQQQGKKVFARGDSFSVSKIWQWRGSKRLPASLCADDGLPWAPVAKDPATPTPAAAHTRQQQQRGGDT